MFISNELASFFFTRKLSENLYCYIKSNQHAICEVWFARVAYIRGVFFGHANASARETTLLNSKRSGKGNMERRGGGEGLLFLPSPSFLRSEIKDGGHFYDYWGTLVRALVSHQWGPGSNPGVDAICGISLLLVLSLAPRGFSPGTPVFPSPQKPTFSNSNSTRNQVDEEPLCGCATFKSLFIYLFILFILEFETIIT